MLYDETEAHFKEKLYDVEWFLLNSRLHSLLVFP